MKLKLHLILSFALLLAGAQSASATEVSNKEQIRAVVLEYTRSQLAGFQVLSNNKRFDWGDDCNPSDRTSCVTYICEKVDSCHFESNLKEVAEACRGTNGDCVKTLCEKTSSCQFLSNAKEMAQACRRVGGECVEIGCEKTDDCQFASNAKEIAKACEGVYDRECVKFACEKLSCQFSSTFKEVARSCAGR